MTLLKKIIEVIEKRAWLNGRLISFVSESEHRGEIAVEYLDRNIKLLKKLSFYSEIKEKISKQ